MELATETGEKRPSASTYHRRARKLLGDICENCGSYDKLHAHHCDGDITNNTEANIQTLCPACHSIVHCQERDAKMENGVSTKKQSQWQRIIVGLRDRGWTQVEIAAYVGCSQPHIGRLQRDRRLDPKWSIGDALIRLHKKVKK